MKRRVISLILAVLLFGLSFASQIMTGYEDVSAAGGGKTTDPNLSESETEIPQGTGKYVFLEIVPDHCFSSLGYYVEKNEPIDLENSLFSQWDWRPFAYDEYSARDGILEPYYEVIDGVTYKKFRSTNDLILSVWGKNGDGSLAVNPSDVTIITMTPEELNREFAQNGSKNTLLNSISFIYLSMPLDNSGFVGTFFKNDYHTYITEEYYNGLHADILGAYRTSFDVNKKNNHDLCNKKYSPSNDFSSDVAIELYTKVKKDGVMFITDYARLQSSIESYVSTNVYKLVRLMRSMDYPFFTTMYPFVTKGDMNKNDYDNLLMEKKNNGENFIAVGDDDKLAFYGMTSKTEGKYVVDDYIQTGLRADWTDMFFEPYFGDGGSDVTRNNNIYYDYWTSKEGTFYTYLANNEAVSVVFNEYLKSKGGKHTWQQLLNYLASEKTKRGQYYASLRVAFNELTGILSQGANYYCRGSVIGWNGDGGVFSGKSFTSMETTIGANADYLGNPEYNTIDFIPGSEVMGYMKIKKFDFSSSVDNINDSFSLGEIIKNKIIKVITPKAPVILESKINVLEIEPYAFYEYNTGEEGIRKIINLLGVEQLITHPGVSISDIPYDELSKYVEVNSITTSHFNGLTRDIVASYDVIIIGDKYEGGKEYFRESNNGRIYFSNDGRKTDASSVGMIMGNDLTDKSRDILIDVAGSGVPILLSQNVYNKTSLADDTHIKELVEKIITNEDGTRRMNVFNISDLNRIAVNGEINKEQYNLRYVLNSVASVVPYIDDMSIAVTKEGEGDTAIISITVNVRSEKPDAFKLRLEIDSTGDGKADDVIDASVNTDTPLPDGYYKGSVTRVLRDGNKEETKNVMKHSDYFWVKAFVTKESGNVPVKYFLDETNDLPQNVSFYVTNLRDATNKGSEYPLDEKNVKILQILPNNQLKNINKNNSLLSTIDRSISQYELEVEAIRKQDIEKIKDISKYDLVIVSDAIQNIDSEYGILKKYMESGPEGVIKPVIFTYGSIQNFDSEMCSLLGVLSSKRSNAYHYQSGNCEWKSGLLPYYGASSELDSEDFYTKAALKVNEGQVNTYPFVIDENISISLKKDAPEWYLDLSKASDVTVWCTLTGDDSAVDCYFNYRGQDAANNYYLCSNNNIYYTMFDPQDGYSTEDERELFVNLIVYAIKETSGKINHYIDSDIYDLD